MNRSIIKTVIFYIFLTWENILLPSVISGTLITTPEGLIPIENIAVNNTLIGYLPNNKTVQVKVTHITTTTTHEIVLITTNKGIISATPDQLFYNPIEKSWIAAQNVTLSTIFFNSKGNHCPCINLQTISIEPTTSYRISTTSPHNFFCSDQQLLTHNFIPIITLGIGWVFGLGSIEFTGLSIGTIIGGAAVGIRLLKKKNQGISATITTQNSGTYGGYNPDPDDNDDNDNDNSTSKRKHNTISKTEFFKSVKKDYEHWRGDIYIRKNRAKGLNKKAKYLKWDHLHNDVEAYNSGGKHLGSYDPKTLQLYKAPDPDNILHL